MRKRSEKVLGIPIKDLVDKRLAGMSYQEIADEYDLSKQIVYGYYRECEACGFDGYDPVGAEKVSRMLRSECTVGEIARRLGISNKNGLLNYINDYHIKGREMNARTVRRLVKAGKTAAYIGRYYGIGQQTVQRWCERNGIDIPKRNRWEKQIESTQTKT